MFFSTDLTEEPKLESTSRLWVFLMVLTRLHLKVSSTETLPKPSKIMDLEGPRKPSQNPRKISTHTIVIKLMAF